MVPKQVKGTSLEVADHRAWVGGAPTVRRGRCDTVKRGEVDRLNVVPSAGWSGRVGTRLIKLCEVALRKGMWWSVHCSARSEESGCEVESLLLLEGARRVSSPLSGRSTI